MEIYIWVITQWFKIFAPGYLPITISRDNIVDPKLLADLLDTEVQSVCFKLLVSHVGFDHSR